MKKKIIELLITVIIAAALDQIVKAVVVHRLQLFESVSVLGDTIRLTLVYNQNGAFSLAPQRLLPFLSTRAFFLVFSLIAASIVLWLYLKTDFTEKWSRFALMLILGGFAGNFIDRVRLGRVIDFIDCDFPDFIMDRWPVFNVADSCVTVGITILIVVSLFAGKHARAGEPPRG